MIAIFNKAVEYTVYSTQFKLWAKNKEVYITTGFLQRLIKI